jgi:AraC-like DNA-binding protein
VPAFVASEAMTREPKSERVRNAPPASGADVARFFRTLCDRGRIEEMFELLPDVSFYMKDLESRWMFCNSAALRSINQRSQAEVLGKNEFDFFPQPIAQAIRNDDLHVMISKKKMTNRIELITKETGYLTWVSTSKAPLFGQHEEVVGLMGITREISTSDDLPEGYRPFQAAIDYIRDNLGSEIKIPELSRLCNLSSSQFRRRFKSVFHLAPAEFILRTRLQAAARRLASTQDPIIHIALDCGFSSQSYFSARFKEFFTMSPNRYRRDWNSR